MKKKSNMYSFINKTKNFIRGECPHKCSYCYVKSSRVKKFYTGKPRLIESQFKSLGTGHFYFVGSMIDMWADDIPSEWISKVLSHCSKYDNRYLLQTKNPGRLTWFLSNLPFEIILGTTIETNRSYSQMGSSVNTYRRSDALNGLSNNRKNYKTMVTIEPIMDFDLYELLDLVVECLPSWVNIGADSKKHNLPEPSPDKIQALIDNLKSEGIEVKLKSNLKRLIKDAKFLAKEFPKG